jgi:hypothetical protein
VTFNDFDDDDLATIQSELTELAGERGVPFGEIQVVQDFESGQLEMKAVVQSDPLLDDGANAEHRRTIVRVTVFTDSLKSDDSDGDSIWVEQVYAIPSKHANFFPVPEEYGDTVRIGFHWELDRETLTPRCCGINDLLRLHYVSVMPNEDLLAFIECCSEVAEGWCQ